MITYKRPTTIGQLFTTYKHLDLSKTREHVKGMSGPCGHCALGGKQGEHNKSMLLSVLQIMGKKKTFPLNQKLTCTNHGIYVATCVICFTFKRKLKKHLLHEKNFQLWTLATFHLSNKLAVISSIP